MTRRKITYGELEDLLMAEGFSKTVVPRSHVAFDRKEAGASLLLPIHKRGDEAPPRHVAMVRGTLVDFGVMKKQDFERWLADPKNFQAA
ncbi:MAG TPA: hypothetical protein VH253_09465 [Phycisphaerae bacterium]|nr:hypothetical protein [Phycisphaerae bacterium]